MGWFNSAARANAITQNTTDPSGEMHGRISSSDGDFGFVRDEHGKIVPKLYPQAEADEEQ